MKLRILVTGLAALALATSCTSGTEGIFASIEREQKIESLGGLSKTATVTSMAELSAPSKYFATGGRALFSRSTAAGTTKWDNSTVGGSTEVVAVGVSGTKVYAVASAKLWESIDGVTWTTTTGITAGETVENLVPVITADGRTRSELVVVTKTPGGSYSNVYRITSGSLGSALILGASLAAGVVAAVHTGSTYYLASESFLWEVNGVFGVRTLVTTLGTAPPSGYVGLLYLTSETKLYLSTRSTGGTGGGLYAAASPSGATASFTSLKTDAKTTSGEPVSFSSLLYNSTNSSLWVATGASTLTEGTGYAELTLPSSYSLVPTTDSNNYNSSGLPTVAVGTLFYGSTGYFLGTVAHGLWKWDATDKVWSQQ